MPYDEDVDDDEEAFLDALPSVEGHPVGTVVAVGDCRFEVVDDDLGRRWRHEDQCPWSEDVDSVVTASHEQEWGVERYWTYLTTDCQRSIYRSVSEGDEEVLGLFESDDLARIAFRASVIEVEDEPQDPERADWEHVDAQRWRPDDG